MKPLLKWAGGKRRQAAGLWDLFEDLLDAQNVSDVRGYSEPFFGSGAVFGAGLASRIPGVVLLNDASPAIMGFWRAVRDSPAEMLDSITSLPWGTDYADHYARIRDRYNDGSGDEAERAALFYWLNRACFNGLWRVNRNGRMNVPVGRYRAIHPPTTDAISDWCSALRCASLMCVDFEAAVPDEGDLTGWLVYCDPPYAGNFSAYTPDGFTSRDQKRLAAAACRWVGRGAIVVVSNSDDATTQTLYETNGFATETVGETRSVSADGNARKRVTEHIYYLSPSIAAT